MAKLSLPYTTDNNLALKPYSDDVYKLQAILNYMVYALMGVLALGVVAGFVISAKLMAVEMLFIVQIAYAGLGSINKLETLLYPLVGLWPVNGYNQLGLFENGFTSMPPRLSVVGYKDYFLANFNTDIVILLLPLIAGLVCFVISKIKK